MRYAIFSDIHANRQAWNAVLADMYQSKIDVPVCLGDVVGYGPCPQEVLDGIRAVTGNFVMGNHDAAACGVLDPTMFNDTARAVIEWTADQLNPDAKTFLREMPMVITDGELMFVHAEIEEPSRFFYIESEEEAEENFSHSTHRITFVGHTHDPTIFAENADGSVSRLEDSDCVLAAETRYIVNVGSVGEPRNPEDIRARYVIFDSDTGELIFRRIEFDIQGYRADLKASGLAISPYFLKVVDSYNEAVALAKKAKLMRDMRTPATGSALQGNRTKRVQLSVEKRPPMKREPLPEYQPQRQSKRGLYLSIFVLVFAASLVGFIFLGGDARPAWAKKMAAVVSNTKNPVERSEIPVVSTVEPMEVTQDPEPLVAVVEKPPVLSVEALQGKLREGLIFYTPFDEAATRKVLLDQSSGKRFLQVGKIKHGIPGKSGNAVQFKKSGLVSNPATLKKMGQLTVSFWIFADKTQIRKEHPGKIVEIPGYGVIFYDDNKLTINLPGGKRPPLINFPPNEKWNHVLVMNDGAKTHLFLNGVRKFTKPRRLAQKKEIPKATIRIGIGHSRFKLDEVAIWSRTLSGPERQAVMKLGDRGQSLVEVN